MRREADHFEHDFIVGLGILRAGIADVNGAREQRAVDLYVTVTGAFEIRADELMCVALENFDDFAFRILAANIALAGNGDQHGIAGGGIASMIGGDKNIAAAIDCWRHATGAHKTVAGVHAAEYAGYALADKFAA